MHVYKISPYVKQRPVRSPSFVVSVVVPLPRQQPVSLIQQVGMYVDILVPCHPFFLGR